jgi:glyoxylase-like metal-dependent hydrolase (beta-lactamase superfamily II)
MKLIPLPAFQDNTLWLLHDGQRELVVDPGDAGPVQAHLAEPGLQLTAILVTHHHPDHIGGVDARRDAPGFGPARGRVPHPCTELSALPGQVRVCGTHEYLPGNLKFATAVEPGDAKLVHYRQQCEERRSRGEPTLPSTIALENSVNPFLRTRQPAVAQASRGHDPAAEAADAVAAFAALRQWKNEFQ